MQILFITANRLGDAVLSTGLLAALLARYPGAQVTVACGPLPAPLFTAAPGVIKVIPLIKAPYAGHWRRLWGETIGTPWDLIVDLRGSLVSRLLRARQRIIWRKNPVRQQKVEELAALIADRPPTSPRLWLSPAAIEQASRLLPADRILAVAPGANSLGKRWPVERYMAIAKAITASDGLLPGAFILLLGDKQDQALLAPYLATLPADKVINLAGTIPLETTAACLARASLYIGNDSGLTHLAAAAGIPTLALFGPGIAWKYRPWGARAAYLSRADDPAREYDLCRDGNDLAALALMERLTVQDVVEAASRLWQNIQP